IVTDIPGTTRDTLEGALIHKGLCVTLVDTAGIRDVGDGDVIEGIGVGRSREAVLGADICVLVVDASERLTEDDAKAAEAARGKRVLLAANKSDLPSGTRPAELEKLGPFDWSVNVSAATGEGVEDLKDAIFEASVGCASCEGGMLATERMIAALSDAAECVGEAAGALRSSIGIDVAGSLLAEASERLCAPLGADASEELLDAIFSNFCIGK
ncbi:MAG: 50S ribosome-binding GTPase, partial [Synergistaceae bacterium]|nr:50S ribosome-binding GTPase [Synergistaceae bacterium]